MLKKARLGDVCCLMNFAKLFTELFFLLRFYLWSWEWNPGPLACAPYEPHTQPLFFFFFFYGPTKVHTLLKTSLLMASMFHRHILSLWTRASSFCRHSSSRCLSSDTAVCALACSWSKDSELCSAKLPSFCWASARFHLHATELFTNSFCFWQASSIPSLYI